MKPLIKTIILKEFYHFLKLNKPAQYLFISILLYNFANPILFLFVDAFLLRKTHDIRAVAFYMLINYAALPFGFYLNGIFLKKYIPQQLYFIGNCIRGISIVLLVYLSPTTFFSILFFGFISGISGGFHWANRNFMTLKVTTSSTRIYFTSLDNVSNIFTSIIVPITVGWFIVLGDNLHLYTVTLSYQIMSLVTLIVVIFSGFIIKKVNLPPVTISQMLFFKVNRYWARLRLFSIVHGLFNGMLILMPVLITLSFLGKEDVLGTTQSYMAILSAIALYFAGKVLKINHRVSVLTVSVLLACVGSLIFSMTFTIVGVLCYLTLQAFSDPFNQVCFISFSFDAMEKEERKTKIHHYSYILDQEIFHNVGRVTGILFFIFLIHTFSNNAALRFTPLILASSQIILLVLARHFQKEK